MNGGGKTERAKPKWKSVETDLKSYCLKLCSIQYWIEQLCTSAKSAENKWISTKKQERKKKEKKEEVFTTQVDSKCTEAMFQSEMYAVHH